VNLLGDSIDTIKTNTETSIDASVEVGVDIDTEKLSIFCYRITRMQVEI
jgi:hypothetical protein